MCWAAELLEADMVVDLKAHIWLPIDGLQPEPQRGLKSNRTQSFLPGVPAFHHGDSKRCSNQGFDSPELRVGLTGAKSRDEAPQPLGYHAVTRIDTVL